MKHVYSILSVLCLFFFFTELLSAQHVLVKPFTVNAPSEYEYLSKALSSIIESRIVNAKITLRKGEREQCDSIITGKISVLGKHVSVDISLETGSGSVNIYPITATIETILPQIEQIIPAMQENILSSKKQETEEEIQRSARVGRSSFFTGGDWQNAIALSIAPRGIRIVDINGDGEKEYIVLGEKELLIYERNGTIFTERAKYSFKGKEEAKYLAVAPINEKQQAILVTVMFDVRSAYSYIFTYEENTLNVLRHGEPYLLGAYYDAQKDAVIPILQEIASYPTPYFSKGVYSFTVQDRKILKGEQVSLPYQGNVFNFTTVKTKEGVRLLTLSPQVEYLSLYNIHPLTLLYKTAESYSSTSYFLESVPQQKLHAKSAPSQEVYYIPTHFVSLPFHTEDNVLLVANAVNRSSVTTTYRSFSRYQIEALRFDSDSFQSLWSSSPISASVADFDVDVNEKGEVELFVLVTYTPVVASFQKHRSSILFQPISRAVQDNNQN